MAAHVVKRQAVVARQAQGKVVQRHEAQAVVRRHGFGPDLLRHDAQPVKHDPDRLPGRRRDLAHPQHVGHAERAVGQKALRNLDVVQGNRQRPRHVCVHSGV